MRLKKFRIWIGDAPMKYRIENKLYYQNDEYLSSWLKRIYDCYGVSHPSYLKFEIEDRLQQFTGFKDKNGNEIYEGDILIGKPNNPFSDGLPIKKVVVWGYDGWILKDTGFTIQEYFNYCNDDVEVGGNIKENPELIPS